MDKKKRIFIVQKTLTTVQMICFNAPSPEAQIKDNIKTLKIYLRIRTQQTVMF